MRGIILAGGTGSRLYPSTTCVCKQLLPVYNKPMIYYPVSVLLLAGISEILIITTPEMIPYFVKLLGVGCNLGIKIEYSVQETPKGLAEAFVIGEKFIGNEQVCLILGDNIFYGDRFNNNLEVTSKLINNRGVKIFAQRVDNPQSYGVVEFDYTSKKVISIEEKPLKAKSNLAITGIYFFDNSVVEKAKKVSPSSRNELEIVDVISQYLEEDSCTVEILPSGTCWFDTGTHDSMNEANNFVSIVERRQGVSIACLEEISHRKGFISTDKLRELVGKMPDSSYSRQLFKYSTELAQIQ